MKEHLDGKANTHQNTLNREQQKAVEATDGPLLILAGAGAGKTKTITYRIRNLVEKGVNPSQILAITFTNKAAKEMRDRVDSLLTKDNKINRPVSIPERPFVSTFHALGVHILREQSSILGIPRHFTIYDRGDSKKAVKDALEELGYDPKQFDPGAVLTAISREKGDGITSEVYQSGSLDYYGEIVAEVWEKYEKTLNKEKALDFDDLLLKTSLLLNKNQQVREYYNSIWKYVHIDEYQDTNKVQYDIARALVASHRNICVVGDIDQNIYSWRGATIENILNFEKDYPDATVVILEENYRSTQTILTAANQVIEKNSRRRKKNLFTKNHEGEKISIIASYTETDEARAVADKVRELMGSGTSPKDIAVLYRANFQSRVLEESFIKKNIPYQILGTRFFDRKEIKDVISYIKAALNRDSVNDLVRIVNSPSRGIGKATILKLVAGGGSGLTSAMRAKVDKFTALLSSIQRIALEKAPAETVKFVLEQSGLEDSFKKGNLDDEERLENVRELVSVASQYDTIEAFLENAALATDQDDLKENIDAVKLMTVHASKGLEFDYVFITGLEEGLFPHEPHEDKGPRKSRVDDEEERRLFYVALTRARKQVFLTYTIVRTIFGAQKVNVPSSFIGDIDQSLVNEEGGGEEPRGVKAIFIDF
jgi:DNA helicase-2/ATP-dependent DNA helicase PcrA